MERHRIIESILTGGGMKMPGPNGKEVSRMFHEMKTQDFDMLMDCTGFEEGHEQSSNLKDFALQLEEDQYMMTVHCHSHTHDYPRPHCFSFNLHETEEY